MKEFINFMQNDIEKEHFSTRDKVVYGFLYPLILILTAILISILEDMVNNNYL